LCSRDEPLLLAHNQAPKEPLLLDAISIASGINIGWVVALAVGAVALLAGLVYWLADVW